MISSFGPGSFFHFSILIFPQTEKLLHISGGLGRTAPRSGEALPQCPTPICGPAAWPAAQVAWPAAAASRPRLEDTAERFPSHGRRAPREASPFQPTSSPVSRTQRHGGGRIFSRLTALKVFTYDLVNRKKDQRTNTSTHFLT